MKMLLTCAVGQYHRGIAGKRERQSKTLSKGGDIWLSVILYSSLLSTGLHRIA